MTSLVQVYCLPVADRTGLWWNKHNDQFSSGVLSDSTGLWWNKHNDQFSSGVLSKSTGVYWKKESGRKVTDVFAIGADDLGVGHLRRVVLLFPQLLHHQQVLVTAVLQVDTTHSPYPHTMHSPYPHTTHSPCPHTTHSPCPHTQSISPPHAQSIPPHHAWSTHTTELTFVFGQKTLPTQNRTDTCFWPENSAHSEQNWPLFLARKLCPLRTELTLVFGQKTLPTQNTGVTNTLWVILLPQDSQGYRQDFYNRPSRVNVFTSCQLGTCNS